METKMEPVLNFTNEVISDKKHKLKSDSDFYVAKLRSMSCN